MPRTHCTKGHALEGANRIVRAGNHGDECRTCRRETRILKRKRQAEARAARHTIPRRIPIEIGAPPALMALARAELAAWDAKAKARGGRRGQQPKLVRSA